MQVTKQIDPNILIDQLTTSSILKYYNEYREFNITKLPSGISNKLKTIKLYHIGKKLFTLCDIDRLFKTIKSNETYTCLVTHDAFTWADSKYRLTTKLLEHCNKNNITLRIETRSDYCAHDKFIELLRGHTIVMHLNESEKLPSVKRRMRAIQKLWSNRIKIEVR